MAQRQAINSFELLLLNEIGIHLRLVKGLMLTIKTVSIVMGLVYLIIAIWASPTLPLGDAELRMAYKFACEIMFQVLLIWGLYHENKWIVYIHLIERFVNYPFNLQTLATGLILAYYLYLIQYRRELAKKPVKSSDSYGYSDTNVNHTTASHLFGYHRPSTNLEAYYPLKTYQCSIARPSVSDEIED